jgi:hypothetical protein
MARLLSTPCPRLVRLQRCTRHQPLVLTPPGAGHGRRIVVLASHPSTNQGAKSQTLTPKFEFNNVLGCSIMYTLKFDLSVLFFSKM